MVRVSEKGRLIDEKRCGLTNLKMTNVQQQTAEQVVLTSQQNRANRAIVRQLTDSEFATLFATDKNHPTKNLIGGEIGLPQWVRDLPDGTELAMSVAAPLKITRIETEKAIIYTINATDQQNRTAAVTINRDFTGVPVAGATFMAAKSSYESANGRRATLTQKL